MKRTAAFVAPALIAILVVAAPLLTGARTLVLRDVLISHLALRATVADALRGFELPLVDPLRAGGQPALGNPNALALYPDNLLLLVESTLGQLNAHFALHWLAAFAAAFWLGRAWGLGREGAAATAAAYALSGYFLSQLNLFNAVAGAALAPALVAAALELGEERTRRRALAAAALVWALLLLGGDPLLGALALALALAVALARHGRRLPVAQALAALACGTLLAAPQIVETARVFASSYRGFWGYGESGFAGRDPRAAIELLLPLFFGRPDLGVVFGQGLSGGHPPLYFALAPGLVVLALAAAAGRPRSRAGWTLAAFGVAALALTFDRGTPIAALLARLPGGELLRFPEKFALWGALALALAAGTGVERLLAGGRARRLLVAATALGAAVAALRLDLASGGAALRRLLPELAGDGGTAAARLRYWSDLATLGLIVALATVALALVARRRPVGAAAAAVALHAVSQLVLLAPLMPLDDAAVYERAPELAARLPAAAVLVHGDVNGTFGGGDDRGGLPDARYLWFTRRAHAEMYAFAGMSIGRRYELNVSPEGLDAFVEHALTVGLRNFTDARRIAVLRAVGVDRLLLGRALEPEGAGGALPLFELAALGRRLHVYQIPDPLPAAVLAGDLVRAPHMNAALEALWAPGFDPRTTAVLAGSGPPRSAPPGSARLVGDGREQVEVEVDSPAGGALVLRRAYLPIWRASIDGAAARPVIAQATRLAVEVPAGRHTVRLWISRAPLRWSAAAALAGLVGVALLARRRRGAAGTSAP